MTATGHILIPSAATIPAEMALEFGELPSAMVPLRGQPALEHISRPLLARGWHALVGHGAGGDIITSYLAERTEPGLTAIDCSKTTSLGESILVLLDALPDGNQPVLINFGDTLIGDMENPDSPANTMAGRDFIAFNQAEETWRWTSFQLNPAGQIKSIQDKLTAPSGDGKTTIFVGLFGISDPASFRTILDQCIHDQQQQDLDPFYEAILLWFNQLPPDPDRFIDCVEWHDLGHIDNYNKARRSIFMNQRFFNDVEVDDARGVLTKRSRNTGKFINEIRWYLKLPRALEHAAPRIFDYSLDVDSPFVEMEFYGYPVLSDLFLYSNLDPGVWERILGAIHQLLNQFSEHRYVSGDTGKKQEILHSMYVGKTLERMAQYAGDPQFALFQQPDLMINGKPALSLEEIASRLPGLADDILIHQAPDFCVIHGDLCLGNILYDRRNSIARTIDPRGSFGGLDIYGDQTYDLAKLSHSFAGHYDHMVNNRFDWSSHDNTITWKPHLSGTQEVISRMFSHFLERHYADRLRRIKLVESLLFLSMVPLHKDRPQAQLAMASRGMGLFSDLAGGQGANP